MAIDYAAIRLKASKAIDKAGLRITLVRYGFTTDPVAGTSSKVLTASQTLASVILPASQGTLEAFDVRFMSDVDASQDVRFVVMSGQGSTFIPEPKDEATFDGATWEVMGCTPLAPDGATRLLYSVGFKLP
jgi:hypothetical protein